MLSSLNGFIKLFFFFVVFYCIKFNIRDKRGGILIIIIFLFINYILKELS